MWGNEDMYTTQASSPLCYSVALSPCTLLDAAAPEKPPGWVHSRRHMENVRISLAVGWYSHCVVSTDAQPVIAHLQDSKAN